MQLTVRQVIDFKVDIDVIGVDDDEVPLVDPFYYEKIELLDLSPIDWLVQELKSLKERTAYVLKRTRDWVSKIIAEKVNGEFQSKERRGNQGESSRMALEATSNEKMQQLDTSDLDKNKNLNQPVKFIVKRRRTKMKGKSTRVNQKGNEPHEKDQRTP